MTYVCLDVSVTCNWLRVDMTCTCLSVMCCWSLIDEWMKCALISSNVWLSWVVYVMHVSSLILLYMWLIRLCIQTYMMSYIMYIHVIHACGVKGYLRSIHAYGFKTILNIRVFKTSHEKGDCWFKHMLWNGDVWAYLKVNLNMWLKKKG